ncbi:DAK2 domain-containing protein [Trichococcus shcherbakoviae]|uniref:DAK2 domain-containing protein n=1 Tax=Trichococcus shcherbakoviae subsp. psychrophilus TaxID=2585775 RepID=A0A5C5E7Q5_9LACT|nr:DAK2 domain-containing protein [Trichococcus shcherbakoviae]TNV69257.1 DAK2 domain-containing protein [Trichococcus shcherbakoviae subsp. psychrophilus]
MKKTELTAEDFKAMVAIGAERLSENAEYVNSLNVFPVPDGDTGTNMNLSFTSGAERVRLSNATKIDQLGSDLAKGLLMGARGNSGVILSQLFRGFSKAIEGKATLNTADFAEAFSHGVETAYKAVMKPVEGTILTVARESAKAGVKKAEHTDDIIELMGTVLKVAQIALDKTPDLLPVLKEVGVVDSGGQGLVYIYEGFMESLTGEKVPSAEKVISQADVTEIAHQENYHNVSHSIATEDIEFGYCTEIMVKLGEGETVTDTFDYDTFRNHLNEIGDSLLVVADDEIVKVHVHTEYPGEVMNYGQKFGSLMKIKVDNMRMQHDAVLEKADAPAKKLEKIPYGVIAVAAGEGVHALFKSMGVSTIINGGQTMNPSTEDILKAIESTNAEKTIILPNNKNIFMAADQAAEVSDADVVVVASKTISQGLTAMLAFNESVDLETNKANMTAELENVVSGQITNAVRDTVIDGLAITKDDFMGIVDGKILMADKDRKAATIETLKKMITDDSEIVTIIFGEDSDEKESKEIAAVIEAEYDFLEVEVQEGNQPVYSYLLSVE